MNDEELLDWFAGQALAGIAANSTTAAQIQHMKLDKGEHATDVIASTCYAYALGMMKVRARRATNE